GKDSIKALTFAEAGKVAADLAERQKLAGIAPPPRKKAKQHPTTPGGVTSEQQGKAWALMYELQKFDPPIGGAGVGDRLCGIITKHFGVSAPPAQPFRFLKMAQGIELIQLLGKMAERAELKSLHERRAGHG
ncbi:DUF1018 domain-containing protein, partial [Ruminococcaceae bacterium OttesenSCG-928-D13]|nr:DUF1018 domain-containing protein [Ruminococcaceae bacterium OttesenSCG-928-D13]